MPNPRPSRHLQSIQWVAVGLTVICDTTLRRTDPLYAKPYILGRCNSSEIPNGGLFSRGHRNYPGRLQ
jgi:hypothetical protein